MSLTHIISSLPSNMMFGVATSSYQIEGTKFGGCGPSHWDSFARQFGSISDGSDGEVACDHYHRFAEDLDLVAGGGFDAYRFSFSWPRLLPHSDDEVNADGLGFYDRLLDGMLERGLQLGEGSACAVPPSTAARADGDGSAAAPGREDRLSVCERPRLTSPPRGSPP